VGVIDRGVSSLYGANNHSYLHEVFITLRGGWVWEAQCE
jgi:hypothetical protein